MLEDLRLGAPVLLGGDGGSGLFGSTMKAIVIHEYGGPEILKLEELAMPEPKDDAILVKVFASGVNPFDGVPAIWRVN